MNKRMVIGVDVGGSHITSAAVDLDNFKIIPDTSYSVKVDNKASKENILKNWSTAINTSRISSGIGDGVHIGFAMPGPFHYKTGLAMFERNDKYESLFNVSIPDQLATYLSDSNLEFRFLNDATAFGVGVASIGKAKNYSKVIAITLGTGFGSAFIKDGIPMVNGTGVPKGGCLWDKPYKNGIGDDYFSTRWLVAQYNQTAKANLSGVREIAQANDENTRNVFSEFGLNMAEFIIPFVRAYTPHLIIFGGNVSHASPFFLPVVKQKLYEAGLDVVFEISDLMEEAAIIGSAKLFDPPFWHQVKDDLPNL